MGARLSKLRAQILNNKGLKALSLLLAVITWHAIQSVISHTTAMKDIPLEIKVAGGWAILDRSANAVDVLFRGSREDIAILSPEQISVVKDISGHDRAGTMSLELTPEDVRGGRGVRPLKINPDQVTISLDREEEKRVPVRVETVGKIQDGYWVQSVACVPETVLLRGPGQRLGATDHVQARPIDMGGRIRSFKLRVPILPVDPNWVAYVEPNEVTAEITIVEKSATKEFLDLPVTVVMAPGSSFGVTVEPDRAKVLLRSRAEVLDTLAPTQLIVFADCTKAGQSGVIECPLQVKAPPGVDVPQIEPATIRVTLKERAAP
ncbi:MAG: hypothetical protein JXR37_04905 [Kiritimatiellae bacterium]|nr:hypothetical protein [Kiritimatiellia bacterium]